MAEMKCYEAVAEIDSVMRRYLEPNQRYYMVGGTATSAFKHPDTVYDHESKTTIPPESAAESIIRDNGTTRDVDIIVGDVLSDEHAADIVSALEKVTPLQVSVFGFDRREEHPGKIGKLIKTAADWTSRRTIDENGIIRYELFPLEQVVKPESYDPWRLMLAEGVTVDTFSPPAHGLAYRIRSISGVRYKDRSKLNEMTDAIMGVPEFREQITSGIYREWLDFALGIYRIQDRRMPLDDPMLAEGVTSRDLALFGAKGRTLAALESNEHIIKLAQSDFGVKALSVFVRDK